MSIPASFDILKQKLTAHGLLDANGVLTEAGYEARHPKLKLEDLGPIVREFQEQYGTTRGLMDYLGEVSLHEPINRKPTIH